MFLTRFKFAIVAILLVLGAGSALIVLPHISHADEASDIAARRAQLESQLATYEKQIADTQKTIDGLHGQGNTLKGTIATLNAQIAKAQLQIKATQTEVAKLDGNIAVHTKTIGSLSEKLTREQDSLADIIRKTQVLDDYSLVEFAFSSENVSSFFGDLDSYATIQSALGDSYNQVTSTRKLTQAEKDALEQQREDQAKLAQVQSLEKQAVVTQQTQKQTILAQTQGQEAQFQKLKAAQEKSAAQIRAELFALAGGSGSISLPAAIALAKTAGAAVGVRPAVVLGILKQETNIGQNLGNGSWSVDMHPTRDVPVFKTIMATLGLDPNTVKVSSAPSYGYGGAMGPGQFIPSTWACYAGYVNVTTGACGKGTDGTYAGPWKYDASKDRIAKAAGHPSTPSNPYNNLDAFTATAMLMADNGATAQTFAAERTAALRYFAGWGNASNPAYAFYGDDVMSFATQFQSDITTLSGG